MAITAGAAVVDFAVDDSSLSTQAQQSGNNTIIMEDVIANTTGTQTNNGQVTATDYVGRLIVVELGAVEQTRFVITDAAGTGTTRVLTVSEDWDTNPVITDTVHVFYNMNDCENVLTELSARTGFYEMTNPIIVGDAITTAGLFIGFGDLIEAEDSKSTTIFSLEVQSLGRLQVGYLQGGTAVAGGLCLGINNAAGEPWTIFESGGEGRLYDARFIASLNPLKFQCDAGSDVQFNNASVFQGTEECHLFDATLVNASVTGASTATEIIRVNAGTTSDGLTLLQTEGIQTADADVSVETIVLKGVIFIQNNKLIILEDGKTYDMVNPTWSATTNTDFDSALVAGSATINDQRSIEAVIQESDGTKLQDAVVNIYEHTLLTDLVMEITSAATTGLASGVFNYKDHIWTTGTGVTRTFGGHALQCGKWLYLPFVANQVSTNFFDGTIVLNSDMNISETTQATALTNGSGITWNEDANPSELFSFTAGSGTLAVGMILTFSPSGAVGTITESMSGDSTAGDIHLDTRDATAIADNDTFSRTGGTAGTFSGTYTNSSKQPFAIHVDANSKTYQVVYDYIAAKTTETTLSVDGELIWEWCRSAQLQALYTTGSSFYTEQSNSKGVFIINAGVGTLDYLTDNAGITWTPPTNINVTFTGMRDNTEVRVYKTSDDSVVGGIENATAGTTNDRSFTWSALATTDTYYKIFNVDYEEIHKKAYIVPATDASLPIQQRLDRNSVNPP